MVELRASNMASGNGRSTSAKLVADWWDGDRRRGGSCPGPATTGSPLPAPPGRRCSATCSIVGASVVTLLGALVAVPNRRSPTGPGCCCNMFRHWNDLVVPCWFSLTVGPDTDIFCDDASCKGGGGGGGIYWEGWVWAELSSCGMGMTVVPSFTVSHDIRCHQWVCPIHVHWRYWIGHGNRLIQGTRLPACNNGHVTRLRLFCRLGTRYEGGHLHQVS